MKPEIKYALLLKSLYSIDEKMIELQQYRPMTVGEIESLHSAFTVEYTYNSTAIEGNTLTQKETAMVLDGLTVEQKPMKDHLEVVGHRDAFLYIMDIAEKELPLTESVIKNCAQLNDKG